MHENSPICGPLVPECQQPASETSTQGYDFCDALQLRSRVEAGIEVAVELPLNAARWKFHFRRDPSEFLRTGVARRTAVADAGRDDDDAEIRPEPSVRSRVPTKQH